MEKYATWLRIGSPRGTQNAQKSIVWNKNFDFPSKNRNLVQNIWSYELLTIGFKRMHEYKWVDCTQVGGRPAAAVIFDTIFCDELLQHSSRNVKDMDNDIDIHTWLNKIRLSCDQFVFMPQWIPQSTVPACLDGRWIRDHHWKVYKRYLL